MKKIKLLFMLACTTMMACSCASNGGVSNDDVTKSGLKPADFVGKVDGKTTALYVLTNKNGMEACITNFGGRIVSIMVPDKNGKLCDVVLGHSSINDYVKDSGGNFGALIGRYGNRINHGRFTLDGKTYQLPQNNYGHCLHGGPKGFHNAMWDAKQIDGHTLELTIESPDGYAGFPGNVDVKVVYTLNDDNSLSIDYSATTDKPTILNLTNHSYFNLSGDPSKDVMGENLMINADGFTPIDSTFMIDGTIAPVAGTPFDFRTPKAIGKDINADNIQLKNGHGYDHNFVLNTKGDINKVAACVSDPVSGITMEVYTIEPGLQVYVGNFLDGKVIGKNGIAYPHRSAICLESQHYPDSPNQKAYPSPVVRPGQQYKSECIYKFKVSK
jgi:aldose 1-epimerase